MTIPVRHVSGICFALALAACSSSSTATISVTLVNTTTGLGVSCDTSTTSLDFNGQSGKQVTVNVTGPTSSAPQFVLYEPDFATQVAGSSPNGAGRARLTFKLDQTGTYHLTFCDANGIGGLMHVTVTE